MDTQWLIIIKDLGGWGAFLIALVIGFRTSFSLAESFGSNVIGELKQTRETLIRVDAKMDRMLYRLDLAAKRHETLNDEDTPSSSGLGS